ncbi:hypothetical protein TrCOL_g8965 [Triparma columacea]|uniref:Aspartate aminotransferase n=1 Tax=Triparma columacea TaxID=722753 RepID=A0A9W7G2T2_9STRA|nr:hypothetical protein TrCOL_g8965 [Triparma columacea]
MFENVPRAPEDSVFRIGRMFTECEDPLKVSCGIGAYRDNDGKPLVMDAVSEAKKRLHENPGWIHEYLPLGGHASFLKGAQKLALGDELYAEKSAEGKVGSLQTLSGTGALYVAGKMYSKFSPVKKALISNPTWGNHNAIFTNCGLEVSKYRYIDESCTSTPKLDLSGFLEDLEAADEGTLVLLQACAHNPTGVDPSQEEWMKVIEICVRKKLVVLLDNAYQGFATGDVEVDGFAIREFVKAGADIFVACSFAKNMGLYGERIGALHVVTNDKESCLDAVSQMKIISRTTYSNPPQFGALIADTILSDDKVYGVWKEQLAVMSERIKSMRGLLRGYLEAETGTDWSHITKQIGMFSYTGLTKEQCIHCREKGSLFMLETGRVSMAGLNEGNVERVAKVMAASIKGE